MKKKILSSLLILSLSSSLFAQYTGPGSNSNYYKSVQAVLDNPIEDANVVLEGYIIKQLNKEKFLFSDDKSQIRVEIDNELFINKIINENTKIKIIGEVEKDFLQSPEIDVDYFEIIN